MTVTSWRGGEFYREVNHGSTVGVTRRVLLDSMAGSVDANHRYLVGWRVVTGAKWPDSMVGSGDETGRIKRWVNYVTWMGLGNSIWRGVDGGWLRWFRWWEGTGVVVPFHLTTHHHCHSSPPSSRPTVRRARTPANEQHGQRGRMDGIRADGPVNRAA